MKIFQLARLILSGLAVSPLAVLQAQSGNATDEKTAWTFGGHAKYQFIYTSYPDKSSFSQILGDHSLDNNLEVRLKFSADRNRWDFRADYQFIAVYSDYS